MGIAGILTRIIGMFYRIPVTNIIGPKGNGYYAAAYQIYTIMLLISSYSLPLAVSKLVSARVGAGEYKNADRIFRGAFRFALFTGGFVCLLILFGADFFAAKVMSESMSGIALKVFAPTLLTVALMGVIRGYFQGMGTMIPTAVSQIVEQIVNAVVSIVAAKFLFEYGTRVGALLQNDNYSAAYGAAGSSLGTGAGALAGFLLLSLMLLRESHTLKKKQKAEISRRMEPYSDIVRILLLTIVPVILSTAVYNVGELLSNSVFNRIMTLKGFGDTKSYTWGVYSGEYKVMLNVPIALSNAMCSSVVPALTACMAMKDIKGAKRKISQVMRFMMLLAFPCAAGLGVLARPIMAMLFKDGYDLAAGLMHFGCINIILYSVSTLSNGILQGINKMSIPVRNAVLSLIVQMAVLICLLNFTGLGIYSVILANFCFAFSMSLLNHLAIRKYIRYRQEAFKTFIMPGICTVIMALVVFVVSKIMDLISGNIPNVIISMTVGFFVYMFLIIRLRVITVRELKSFKMGAFIAAFLKMSDEELYE